MFKKIKTPYLISGLCFLGIAFFGKRYLSWRLEAFAFLLMIYLVVIIGIRLDEMAVKLSEIQAQLTQLQQRKTRQ